MSVVAIGSTRARLSLIAAACAALVAFGACSGSSGGGSAAVPASVVLKVASTATLDRVLTDGAGRILYGTGQEAGAVLDCAADCLTTWPLLTVKSASGVRAATNAIRRDLIGTIPGPGHSRVVTYGGYPLHTYFGDTKSPGSGEGIAGYSAVGLDGLPVRIPASRVSVPTSTP